MRRLVTWYQAENLISALTMQKFWGFSSYWEIQMCGRGWEMWYSGDCLRYFKQLFRSRMEGGGLQEEEDLWDYK